MFSKRESHRRKVNQRKSKSGLSDFLLENEGGSSSSQSPGDQSKQGKSRFKREVELHSPNAQARGKTSRSNERISISVSESDDGGGNTTPNIDVNADSEKVEEGYTWDYCLVLPNPEHEEFKSQQQHENFVPAVEIIERLQLAKLETTQFYSGDGDEIIVKIRAGLDLLRHHAEYLGTKMLLDQDYLENVLDNQVAKIGDAPEVTSLSPYEMIYAPYNDSRRRMFENAAGLQHPFSSIIRIKIIYQIIVGDGEDCCSLNMRRMSKDGSSSVIAYYPLHDDEQRSDLERSWFHWRVHPWEQPIDDVKEYLGEKVALYFEFTGHYTTFLLPLSLVGIFVAIYLVIMTGLTGDFDTALSRGYLVPFFCVFVSVWAQLMLEYWKRKEARKSMEWGTSDFEDEETERPEFHGLHNKEIHSIINGRLEKYYPPRERSKHIRYSNSVIACMIVLVLSCVSGIFGLQYFFSHDVNDDNAKSGGSTGVSVLSAVQIIILNQIYSKMAIRLNDQENHRTDTEYDDALIAKLFLFSFVNSYASLYYISFIKTNIGETCQGSCMVELCYQLTIVFATQLTVAKVTSYATIKVGQFLKERKEKQEYLEAEKQNREIRPPSAAELQNRFEEYDPSLGVLYDYAQIVVQYGYVTLFVSANPLAPLLAYISNWVEVRMDGWKLLYMTRRVLPTGAEDIGTWAVILQLISIAAVVTNAGIVCFTMKILTLDGVGTVWIFIGFQYAILIAMAMFAYLVDDVPEEVAVQLKRQQYLADRAQMVEEELREADLARTGKHRPALTSLTSMNMQIHDRDITEKQN